MATPDRPDRGALTLLEEVEREPDRFDFFQVLRRIERAFPEHARLGQGQHPSSEPVRLTQETSLAFSPSVVRALVRRGDGPPRLVTNFLGLLGPNGPLPLHLTEYTRDRLRNVGDATFAHFLDMFHHRILSLFYRAHANAQPTSDRDRPGAARFPRYVGSLFGNATPTSGTSGGVPDTFLLYFAGRLAARTRNAEGLAAMAGSLLALPARLEQFVGEWVDMPEPARARVGGPGVGSRLGRGVALGRRAWMLQGRFRLEVGPVTSEQAQRLLPGGDHLPPLAALVRTYAGDTLTWELVLVFEEGARVPCRLGRGTRLGPTFWLGAHPRTVVVQPPAASPPGATSPYPHDQLAS